jgi:G:T-mismatch repair DNA endonuclease (very short patch repair protein)
MAAGRSGRDLNDAIRTAASSGSSGSTNRQAIKARFNSKVEKDARNRRSMTANGWTCMAVTDEEIDRGPEAIAKAVAEIAHMHTTLSARSAM